VGVERLKKLTLKDLKASATRNAASMVSNYSVWCGRVELTVYREISTDTRRLAWRDDQRRKWKVEEKGCVSVVVEEKVISERSPHQPPAAYHPQLHLSKIHERPLLHNHAKAGRKGHAAVSVNVFGLTMNCAPQFVLDFITEDSKDDP
jgi:hypothetical protein